jgi:hypothetical protein
MIMERALFGEDASEKPRDHVLSCIVVISNASTFFLIFALGLCTGQPPEAGQAG